MKNVTFGRVLSICFIVAIILTVINSHTLRNSLIHSAIFPILGISLFIIPVYPAFLENRYDKERCVVKIIQSHFVIEISPIRLKWMI